MTRRSKARLGAALLALAMAAPAAAQDEGSPPPETGPGGAPQAPVRSPAVMNPAIGVVFQMIGTTSLQHESDDNGFDLSEAEVSFQSVVDPYARVDLFVSLGSDGSAEVEEAAVTTLALPASLQLKGGRFKSALGRWNTLHTHAFFTVDRPDALVNLLGGESLTSDGLSLSWLLPGTGNLYLELVTEVGTTLPGPSFNSSHGDLCYLEHLKAFFNTGPGSTLEFGLTGAWGRTGTAGTTIAGIEAAGLTGILVPADLFDSRLAALDITWKWKPLQMNVYRSFLWQTEVVRSRRDLEVLTPAPALEPGSASSLGAYTYLEYQPRKRWRAGLRYDLAGFPDSGDDRERTASAVLRFQPSEFQELRFQVKQVRRNAGAAARFGGEDGDTLIFFEWIPAIGAHGAHKY